MNRGIVRVIKVGGSLFKRLDLPRALRDWLHAQPRGVNILVAGGGAWAEAIRDADANFGVGETAAHWLCVRLMSVTAQLLARLLPEAEYEASLDHLRQRVACGETSRPVVFDVESFLQSGRDRNALPALPANWTVTSDSIAAHLAVVISADELVLLKSTCPSAGSLRQAAVVGYVDRFFPTAAQSLASVRCVNLSVHRFPESRLVSFDPSDGKP